MQCQYANMLGQDGKVVVVESDVVSDHDLFPHQNGKSLLIPLLG